MAAPVVQVADHVVYIAENNKHYDGVVTTVNSLGNLKITTSYGGLVVDNVQHYSLITNSRPPCWRVVTEAPIAVEQI